jgi:hypothetical protein
MAKKVIIGNKEFRSQKDAEQDIRNIFNNIGICNSIKNETDKFSYIFELVKRHPDFIRKCNNLIDFKLVANKLNKKAFELNIVKKDGSVEDISWRLCITGKPKTDKHELMSALRYSIEDQIKEYRDSVCIDKCMLCNEYINNDINIDHIIHFEKLVNDFHSSIMLKIPIKFDDANDNSNRQKFKKEDSDYENAWKEYHKNNSKLRVLCQSCNLRREKYKA